MSTQLNSVSSPYARNLTIVKGFFKKPIVLCFALLSLAMFVVSIFNQMAANETAQEILDVLSDFYGKDLGTASNSGSSTNVLTFIITGITVLCFFMIYFMSQSSNPNVSPAPFFTILHVFSVIELVIVAISTVIMVIVTIIFAVADFSNLELEEYMSSSASYFKTTIVVALIICIACMLLAFFLFNSQTAFLKSCKRSCKEPALQKKGAKSYGNLCFVFAVLDLVGLLIVYLVMKSMSDMFAEMMGGVSPSSFTISAVSLISSILPPVSYILRGVIAKSYAKYVDENAGYAYAYAAAPAAARTTDANPIGTFNAQTRPTNNAIAQAQPHLYGEEEDTSNRKSQYIPKEFQEDYTQQQVDPQQNPYGAPMQYEPQFGQPDPYGGVPQDPYAAPQMNYPYGQPVQNPDNYNPYNNNGMM